MSGSVRIEFDPKTNKLLIRAPIWMVDQCRGIPNRRWLKSKKAWSAPVLRRNVEYLRRAFPDAWWDEGAKHEVAKVEKASVIRRAGFPSWYPFKREPMKKQREALDALYGVENVGFIMDPGTGKTQTCIDWATAQAMEGTIDAVLVAVPNAVTYNWIDELAEVCPIEYAALVMDTGSYRKTERFLKQSGVFRWLIVSWEALSQGKAKTYAERFLLSSRAAMLADESSWIKNHQATRTVVATELGKLAKTRAIMTGTPVLSRLADLFSQMEFLSTHIIGIGDFYSFRNRYVVMGGFENKQIVGYQNVEELMELIKPYVFVARRSECVDLPPKTPKDTPPGVLRRVEMGKEQRELYNAVKSKDKIPQYGGYDIPIQNTLEKFLRMHEIIQGIVTVDTGERDKKGNAILQKHYIYEDPTKSPKIMELLRLVDEFNPDDQAVIFTPYRLDVEAATQALRKVYGDEAVGNLPRSDDKDGGAEAIQAKCRDFRAGKFRFLVCSQRQGGIGLNLQSARYGIYLGNTQNLEQRIQSEGRIYRTGQKNSVTYYDIVADNSEDTKSIIPSLIEKINLAEYIQRRLAEGATMEDLA